MAEPYHVSVVAWPDGTAIREFLHTLRETADALARDAKLPFRTVEKWYRDKKPIEPSATSLLRAVVALGAEDKLRDWLQARGELSGDAAAVGERVAVGDGHSGARVSSGGTRPAREKSNAKSGRRRASGGGRSD